MANIPRKFKRQYLWVSQDFYNFMMEEANKLRQNGFSTGAADLTHKLVPIIKENVVFEALFPSARWKKKKRRMI